MLQNFIYLHLKYIELSNSEKQSKVFNNHLFLFSTKIVRANFQANCFPPVHEAN